MTFTRDEATISSNTASQSSPLTILSFLAEINTAAVTRQQLAKKKSQTLSGQEDLNKQYAKMLARNHTSSNPALIPTRPDLNTKLISKENQDKNNKLCPCVIL